MIAAYRALVRSLEQFPDSPSFFDRCFQTRSRQLGALLVFGLLLRCSTFGDTNLHIDETFYFLVGQEMHRGAIPYVDIWDRKPVGLFLIYYVIAGVSKSVVAYQIAAWLFASSTAMVINLIARRWAGTQGALLAAATYLLMLGLMEGYGGQAPVFYNLLIASSALLILDGLPQLERGRATWRIYLAMGLAGLALTVKQTTLFEAVFFGFVVVYYQLRSGAPALRTFCTILLCALLGAIPTTLAGVSYYWIGHWPEFWQAMITSNLAKAKAPFLMMFARFLLLFSRICFYLGLSWVGIWVLDRDAVGKRDRVFLICWTLAAMAGVLAVPNFYSHYVLPLLVPLAITSSVILGRRDIGVFLATVLALFSLVMFNPFDRATRVMSMQSMEKLAAAIKLHDPGGGLMIFDGPPYLYPLTGKHPLSPLTFPNHMNELIERNVSQIDTLKEVNRVLSMRPGVVVVAAFPSNYPANTDTRDAVMSYVVNNCSIVEVATAYGVEHKELIAVWGDCHPGASDLSPGGPG